MSQSFLKAALDGLNGAGKSGTAARLAVGISKECCGSAPVLVFDSEERYRFYKVTIFDVEGVPLLVYPGKSLFALQEALDEADKQQCCVFIGDQLTTPWLEGVRAFSYENGSLPFDRRQQLMNQWEPVVNKFRYGKFHAICCGRLGYHWENIEDEYGDLKLIQGDSKFNAGGGSNFGYEADLELEVRRRKRRLASILRGKTSVEHVCDVIKDAAAGILNGEQFVFPSQAGRYKAGDYKPVLDSFRPYLEMMKLVSHPSPDSTDTRDLLVSGKTNWAKDQSERKSLLEELDANLSMCFPSGEGKSKLAKMFRDLTLEYLNGFISWSRMEGETTTRNIERDVFIIRAARKRIDAGEIPTNQESLRTLLDLCAEDVLHPGRNITLLEALGRKSVEKITGPKPVNGKAKPEVVRA
jgi:hypothetical protein